MYTFAVDMASKTVGVAITLDEDLVQYDSYLTKVKDKNYRALYVEMSAWVLNYFSNFIAEKALVSSDFRMVIEDVFVGAVNPMAVVDSSRICGAILFTFYRNTGNMPILISAREARKAIGLEANLSKVEYQMWAADRFQLGEIKQETRGEVLSTLIHWENKYRELKNKVAKASPPMKEMLYKKITELDRVSKNTLNRMSTAVKNEINLNEHEADAIVLSQCPMEIT